MSALTLRARIRALLDGSIWLKRAAFGEIALDAGGGLESYATPHAGQCRHQAQGVAFEGRVPDCLLAGESAAVEPHGTEPRRFLRDERDETMLRLGRITMR